MAHWLETSKPTDGADGDGEETQVSLCGYSIRNALRRKPTIIRIGEARDKSAISGCVEAALAGIPVYSTIHVIGVRETLLQREM